MATVTRSAPRFVAVYALLVLAAVVPWSAARAQQCVGTNETQLNSTLQGLTRIDRSNQGAGGLAFYHPNTVTQVQIDYFNDDSKRLKMVADQAHANRYVPPQFFQQDGILVDLVVFSAPDRKHMCPQVDIDNKPALTQAQSHANQISSGGQKRDTVHLYLVGAAKRPLIGILRMTQGTHGARIRLKLPIALLAEANGKPDPQINGMYNISAEWFGLTTASSEPNNAKSHWTGADKGHSAMLMVQATEANLRALGNLPKTSWHGGGDLNEEVGLSKANRDALVQRHSAVLRPADRLSTTLEGESEYKLADKATYERAIQQMDALTQKQGLGFAVVKKSGGETRDTYYDFEGGTLMKKKVLLRRRYVPANDAGKDLFLFAVKAKNESRNGLMVRLSAQFNMSERKVAGNLNALTKLLLDDKWNPFAVIVKAALGLGANLQQLKEKGLKPVFVVHSSRHKYAITNITGHPGQSIDVTLDDAFAVHDGKKTKPIYSIEFGIDHPGSSVVVKTVEAREHHQPTDLKQAVFQRPDIAPFTQVRNKAIEEINKGIPQRKDKLDANLNTGGFKAIVLSVLPFNEPFRDVRAVPPLVKSKSTSNLQPASTKKRGLTRTKSSPQLGEQKQSR